MNKLRLLIRHSLLAAILAITFTATAQVPQLIHYQSRVAVGGVNFEGSGQFKFALVNTNGSTTFWSNDGTSTAGSEPTAAVTLPVTKGLYSVHLGDAALANMTAIPASVFTNADVRLRVWFNDGTNGSQLLTPDHRIAAVGYAMMAGGVNLPATSGATTGVISQNGGGLLHTFGSENLFAGTGAGNFTMTGASNVAAGFNALQNNTTGGSNVALGQRALLNNTTGYENTAVGSAALSNNSTGTVNTAIGNRALFSNTTGYNNTATGHHALLNNTTGINNIAAGLSSLAANTVGIENTAYGINSLSANTTGNNNIAIGNGAGGALTTGSNNIAIGSGGVAGESNTTRIGSGQTRAFIAGISGVTASGGAAVFVNGSGQLGTSTSSRRFKENIESMEQASEAIYALRPVTFRYKPELDAAGLPQFGLIAEEVSEVDPDLVVRDSQGEIQTVRYEQVNAMLLNEFLKEHAKVKGLEARLAELEAKDQERDERLRRLEQAMPSAAGESEIR